MFGQRHTHHSINSFLQCTLTSHFIRYTLLVPGWTPFAFFSLWRQCAGNIPLIFCPYWHDSITQLLQICQLHMRYTNLMSHFTISQRCSIGLRSGDSGGHLSVVNTIFFFQFSFVQFWWARANCNLSFIEFTCLELYIEICFKVQLVRSETLFCMPWLLRVVIWVTSATQDIFFSWLSVNVVCENPWRSGVSELLRDQQPRHFQTKSCK